MNAGWIAVVVLYAAAGAATLVVYLRRADEQRLAKLTNAPMVFLFWPLSLLSVAGDAAPAQASEPALSFGAEIGERLRQIESAAAECADWIGELVSPQMQAIRQACHEVGIWQARVDELEQLLRQPDFDEQTLRERWSGVPDPAGDGAACLQNIAELRRLHGEYRQRIDRFHLRLERVGSQLMVLRFCDTSNERAEAEIEQLIALVDSLRETRQLSETASEPLAVDR